MLMGDVNLEVHERSGAAGLSSGDVVDVDARRGLVRRRHHDYVASWADVCCQHDPLWRKSSFVASWITSAPSEPRSRIYAGGTRKSGVEAPRGRS